MFKSILGAPTSTIIGALVCTTIIICTAMFTNHDSFLSDLMKVVGGITLGAGALHSY